MTEEEYFRKNYSDSCYGDKPLNPLWDFFQDGVEFGERQSKERIEDLEAQIGQLIETISELLSFEGNLDPYMYECDNAQQGELLKPFNKAKELLKKYECKKCNGKGIIFTKKYHNKITCPVCNGEGFIFNKEIKEK